MKYSPHAVRRFTLLPSQKAYTHGAPVTIDEQGFRRNSSTSLYDGPVVSALGDSFTFGLGVADEDTWPSQLERRLCERIGRPLRVVNGGTISYGVFQELDIFRAAGIAMRPRTVVHALYWNDFMNAEPASQGSPSVVTPEGYLAWDRPSVDSSQARRAVSWVFSHSALLFAMRQAAGALVGTADGPPTSSYASAYSAFLQKGLTAEEWSPIEAFYRDLQAIGHQHHFTLFVVILPVNDIVARPGAGSHMYPTAARQRLEHLGIQYLDAFSLGERWLLREDAFSTRARCAPERRRLSSPYRRDCRRAARETPNCRVARLSDGTLTNRRDRGRPNTGL